jgi:nucleoredoxin
VPERWAEVLVARPTTKQELQNQGFPNFEMSGALTAGRWWDSVRGVKTWAVILVGGWLALGRVLAALPTEVTVTTATRLEIVSNGKAAGSVGLAVGERLELIEVADAQVVVRYRRLTGRVLSAHTDLPRVEVKAVSVPAPEVVKPALQTATTVPAPADATEVVGAPVAKPAGPAYAPSGVIERALAGKLVAMEGGGLRAREPARLAGMKFFGIYFSASWCGPCRQFTPELVDAYGKIRALYPEFEIVHVNRDRTEGDMAAYVRDDKMPWPALRWSALRHTPEIERFAGGGIPCLVLIDENGKVLSDSYRWGRYVGPDAVLDDTWKLLRTYRRTHPRPKA